MKAYRHDLEDFATWCKVDAGGLTPLPAVPRTVALYVTDIAGRGLKAATIQRRLAAIAQLHQEAGLEDPTKTKAVKNTHRGIVREIGSFQEGKAPMIVPTVRRVLSAFGGERGPAATRDRALLLLGLEEDRGDRFRRPELNGLLDGVGRPLRVLLRVRDVAKTLQKRLEGCLEAGDSGRGKGAHRGPVVGDLARDHLVPPRLPVHLVVLPGELDDGLDSLRTRGDEEGAVEVPRRYLGDLRRQLQAPRVLEAPVGEEAELLHLPGGDLGELRPPVPDLRRKEASQPVYVSAAPIVGHVGSPARDYDRQLRPVLGVGRKMEHQVLHPRQPRGLPVLPEAPHHIHTPTVLSPREARSFYVVVPWPRTTEVFCRFTHS